jgi:hypothetical protein
MRELHNHTVDGNASGRALTITVLDQPGYGGAPRLYEITGFSSHGHPSIYPPPVLQEGPPPDPLSPTGPPVQPVPSMPDFAKTVILFQDGDPKVAANGITNEVLLAILIDRMRGFQMGPFKCNANQYALDDLESALSHLQSRTRERIKRGVEGTNAV